jgi:hypothetical protein
MILSSFMTMQKSHELRGKSAFWRGIRASEMGQGLEKGCAVTISRKGKSCVPITTIPLFYGLFAGAAALNRGRPTSNLVAMLVG